MKFRKKLFGEESKTMNDIEILKEMLILDVQILPQEDSSVELTDVKSKATLILKGLPKNSMVIRADDFQENLSIFKKLKMQPKRADFVVISNKGAKKWMIYIETQLRNWKKDVHVEAQLKGAQCFMAYCKCIGKSFWESKEFLEDYEHRFVSVTNVNLNKKGTRPDFIPSSKNRLHNRPDAFLKISGISSLHFHKLISKSS